jgi:hypothetical protein
VRIRGENRDIGSWIWRSWPVGAVHPESLDPDQSDRCLSPVWPVQILGWVSLGWMSWWVPCCLVLLQFRVCSVSELDWFVWWIWDFLAWSSLSGELHHPD